MSEINVFENKEDLSFVASESEILKVLNFINRAFSTEEFLSNQLDNCKKLSAYLIRNKIVIGELESEKLLEKSNKLNFMFSYLANANSLVKINNYPGLLTLLDIYCQRTNAIVTADASVELYGRDSSNDLDLFKLYLSEIGQYKILTVEEERELAYKSFNGDLEARNKLVEHNLRLVIPLAKRFQGFELSLTELVLYGNEGITLAASKFNPDKGCRFSTYATWWIKQCMHKGVREVGRNITLPAHVHELLIKVKKEIAKYTIEHGDLPSDQYLAKKFDVSVDKIIHVKKCMEPIVSLSVPLGEDGNDGTLADMIVDEEADMDSRLEQDELTEIVTNLLNSDKLNEKEREIIKMRLGFYGEEKTLEEIGVMYNLSRERIRQIEKIALKKILSASRAYKLGRIRPKNIISLARTK